MAFAISDFYCENFDANWSSEIKYNEFGIHSFRRFSVFQKYCFGNELVMSWKKNYWIRVHSLENCNSCQSKIYLNKNIFWFIRWQFHRNSYFKSHQNAIEWKHVGLQFIVQIMGNLWTYFAVQSHLMSSYQPNMKTVCITSLPDLASLHAREMQAKSWHMLDIHRQYEIMARWKGTPHKEKPWIYRFLLPLWLFRHILMVFNNTCHIKLASDACTFRMQTDSNG